MQKTDLMPALNLDIVGAVEVKANLLGIPYQKLKSLTSFSQAQTMAAALQSGGAVISVRYEGWTNRGLLNAKAPKDAKPLSVLGGNTGFDTLAAFLRDSGGQLWPDVDFLRFRQSGNGISRGRDSIKNAFGEETVQYDYMLSVYAAKLNGNHYRFLRSDKILSVSKLFLENYKKRNVNAVSLGTLGEYCYSDYNAAGGSGRTKFAAAAEEIMKTAAQSNRVAVAGRATPAQPFMPTRYGVRLFFQAAMIFLKRTSRFTRLCFMAIRY